MNKNTLESKSCQEWEEPISAFLDGELIGEEIDQLKQHLASCPNCLAMQSRLQQINESVVAQVDWFADSAPVKVAAESKKEPAWIEPASATGHSTGWRSAWRLIPVTAAAAVVASLFMLPTKETKATISVDDIARPIVELEMIERQQRRDQLMLLKTLEYDLRSLKIELRQMNQPLEDLSSETSEQIELISGKVDQLIAKINQIESQNLSTRIGVENDSQN